MKKFIALTESGNQTSGLQTKGDAVKWAEKYFTNGTNAKKILICEVTDVVERAVLPVTLKEFKPEPEAPQPVAPKQVLDTF